MTKKECIRNALNHQEMDQVPFVILDGGAWVASLHDLSFRELLDRDDCGAKLIVDAFEEAGSQWVSALSGFGIAFLSALGCPVELDKKNCTIDTGPCIQDPETEIPQLDKSQIRGKLEGSEIIQKLLKQTREIRRLVGPEEYIAYSFLGPFSAAGVMVGAQNLMYLLVDDEDLVKQLLDYTTAVCGELMDLFWAAGAEIPVVAEPTGGGEMISLALFEEWVSPTITALREQTKGKCDFFLMHSCGRSGDRVPALRERGVQGYSVDAPVDLKKAMEDAQGKLVMFGKVSPSITMAQGTAQEVYQEAKDNIALAGHKNYILMPGCDLAARTPMENVKALARASRESAGTR
jgi:uroporphyrinogen decarboxylase